MSMRNIFIASVERRNDSVKQVGFIDPGSMKGNKGVKALRRSFSALRRKIRMGMIP
jgi:hypothetical protein